MRISTVCVFILVSFFMLSDGRSCIWSARTAMKVMSCPVTKEQWDERAKIKNCTSLARVQNCTKSSNFKYHCVINEFEDAFIEVCAPVYKINGYCAEYNTVGARIQLHYDLKCSDVKPQCADQYTSTDAYIYSGCYDVVEQNQLKLSSVEQNMSSATTVYKVLNNPVLPDLSKELGTGTTVGIVVGGIILVGAVTTFFCVRYFKNRRSKRRNSSTRKHQDQGSKRRNSSTRKHQDQDLEDALIELKTNYSPVTIMACEYEHFRYAIENGKGLKNMVRKEVTEANTNEKQEDNKDKTIAFLNAYDNVNEHFVETQMTSNCSSQLEKTGMAILIGKQGCGKTLTAIHIMNSYRNGSERWTPRKFTTWEDLLMYDLPENTLVYIDNILDGYMYGHELKRWWSALCYFYFECINTNKHIRLLITAKDNVIERACSHINASISTFEKMFFVRADSNPLSLDQKIEMLKMQMKIAEKLRNNPPVCITADIKNCIEKQNGPVGYPLCAHLYAFEGRGCKKDTLIFDKPREYVRSQIAHEIEKEREDKYGVKTLFLFLMFYQSSDRSNHDDKLKLIYKDECSRFLGKISEELLQKMEPLNFVNLSERAQELEESVLIKHGPMYEFKHKIYLEGVIDYFIREVFDVAVQHFPLDIMHAYEFPDMSVDHRVVLMRRLQTEILTNEVSKTFSCKIFEEPEFENMFCEQLRKENTIEELIFLSDNSAFELPIIFWAAKYGLTKISKFLWDSVKENTLHKEVQFFLARFGECCEKKESYIKNATFPLNINNLKRQVYNFRESGSKDTILHLLVSSNKSDCDAHQFFRKILLEAPEQSLTVEIHLLNLAFGHTTRSRILCILEMINQVNERLNVNYNESIKCLIDPHYKAFWELEWTVRICIALASNKIHSAKLNALITENSQLKELINGKPKKQSDMALAIQAAVTKCQHFITSSSGDTLKTKDIPFEAHFGAKLKAAVRKSIRVLSKWEAKAEGISLSAINSPVTSKN